jgi:hypothetical protein
MSEAVKKILRTIENQPWKVMFLCPGCGQCHYVNIAPPADKNGPVWGFNGDYAKPTFFPSVLVRGTKRLTDAQIEEYKKTGVWPTPVDFVCHFFVRDGVIQYLSDCTHQLARQNVPMEAF